MKGVPIRIAVGQKDIENSTVEIFRRDKMEKKTIELEIVSSKVEELLIDIQKNIFSKALKFRDDNIRQAENYEDFKNIIETHGGFVSAHWDGTIETEDKIKKETKATIRCIPFEKSSEPGNCMISGKLSKQRVIFAKAY